LKSLWTAADDAGFDWISVWDHFVPVTPLASPSPDESTRGDGDNHEAVAMHTALALATRRARVGCLVYNVSYRSPAVIAKSAATIDHLSNGRAVVGLGAGYLEHEYLKFGFEFPSAADRSTLLASSAREIRRLLAEVVRPAPLQARLPIFIGGGGERRTIPTTAVIADGWNLAMPTLTDFSRKNASLTRHSEAVGRDPATIERTVSLGLCFDEESLPVRFGERWETLRPAILSGSTQQVVDKVAAYVAAGADTIILSLRHPYDTEEIERFAHEVVGVVS
jgi:alkanesulfonate monooxygenase SsuD/methylene tetrahydromethanopterin reductase-like flavin-dependent oxidoreductase (luciferase family)